MEDVDPKSHEITPSFDAFGKGSLLPLKME
jgi:hypothetical protein